MALHTDLICGHVVDDHETPWRSTYQGKAYYFCEQDCKRRFDHDPVRYIRP